jgi:hypothetical protein
MRPPQELIATVELVVDLDAIKSPVRPAKTLDNSDTLLNPQTGGMISFLGHPLGLRGLR